MTTKIIEKGKTKRPVVIHNLVKIKALLFLEMRRQTESRMATAREITIATGAKADSLYVLLRRWYYWDLVDCNHEVTPFTYAITKEGLRYLSKIDNWFFSGYYSKKRKKRVPGYRGKVEALKKEIAIASKAIFWWRYPVSQWQREQEANKGIVYYIKAPFETADDFIKIEGSEGRAITWAKSNLLIVKFDSTLSAWQFCRKWGCPQTTRDLGQAIVDSKVGMVWAKDE